MRIATALTVLLLTACRPSAEPVRIGLAGPFSDAVGGPMRQAAELAAEEINEAGGIGGRPIELIVRDDRGDPDSARALSEFLDLKWPMASGRVLKHAVLITGTRPRASGVSG